MVNNTEECILEFMGHLILQGAKCLKDMFLNMLFNIMKKEWRDWADRRPDYIIEMLSDEIGGDTKCL